MTAIAWLKSEREKSLLRRHPWVFASAIRKVEGDPQPGETIDIRDSKGRFLGRGAYSPASQIRIRVWNWDEQEPIGPDFFRQRLSRAIQARLDWINPGRTNAYRLVHAESDGLPGLVVDRYADILVMQALSSGAEYWLETFAELLLTEIGAQTVFERSDADVRALEGLPERSGTILGADPPERVKIQEKGVFYSVDLRGGHKSGFYLDQRENRARIRELAHGRDVLDGFAYSGGFSLNAVLGGAASVTAIEASPEALAQARENLALNNLPENRIEWVQGDVFQVLRAYRDAAKSFDLIVLDPPKFAPTAAQAQRAARGYKDINLLAFKLLRPGGLLLTFSCSGGVSEDLFQKILAGAALDAGVKAQILERMHQGLDHPVALNFPEGAYLKGFVIRVER